jgi:hypothetical protein
VQDARLGGLGRATARRAGPDPPDSSFGAGGSGPAAWGQPTTAKRTQRVDHDCPSPGPSLSTSPRFRAAGHVKLRPPVQANVTPGLTRRRAVGSARPAGRGPVGLGGSQRRPGGRRESTTTVRRSCRRRTTSPCSAPAGHATVSPRVQADVTASLASPDGRAHERSAIRSLAPKRKGFLCIA